MKHCPYCAEEVQDDAVQCKHCGEWLEKEALAAGQPITETETTHVVQAEKPLRTAWLTF